jgi:hypothetical protein
MRSQKYIDLKRQLAQDRAENERAFDRKKEEMIAEHTEKAFSRTFRDGPGGLGTRNRQFMPCGRNVSREPRKPRRPGRTVYVFRDGQLVPKE